MHEDPQEIVKALDPDLHDQIIGLLQTIEELKGHNFTTALLVAAHLGCDELQDNPGSLRGSAIIAK